MAIESEAEMVRELLGALLYQEKSIDEYEKRSGNLIKGITRDIAQKSIAKATAWLAEREK